MATNHSSAMNRNIVCVCFALVVLVVLSCPGSEGLLYTNNFPSTAAANVFAEADGSNNKTGALFLTPYIKAGKIKEAQALSEVKLADAPHIKSYSGFLTVNETTDSNLFFWFFPAKSGKVKDVPVLLWLDGGPGGSSMFGLLLEHGPFRVNSQMKLVEREFSWNKEFAVVYVDNPVGTGFSFTNGGYVTNELEVSRDLYEALTQFFTLYDAYKGNPLIVTGESYAGKYVPAISYKIHKLGQEAKNKGINLQGMAIGDGLCDPRNMLNYGEYLYQVGLLDERQRDFFISEQEKAAKFIDNKEFLKAYKIIDSFFIGELNNGTSYFTNFTGYNFFFNFWYDQPPADFFYYSKFMDKKETRAAVHVGNLTFHDGLEVRRHLLSDIMDSVKPWIEELLNAGYRMLFYSGQLDVIVAAPLTESFLKKLQWKGANKYHDVGRSIYKVQPNDTHVAGYVRRVDNLYQIIVRNAGHILPYDQPRVAHDMITRFVKNIDY